MIIKKLKNLKAEKEGKKVTEGREVTGQKRINFFSRNGL
jgi:hypothetical protein